MPIFEYECKKCEKKFEVLLRSSSSQAECPFCGSGEVKKLLSTFAAKVDSSPASSCANADICPAAGSHSCTCTCNCGHHH
ncbi:MAG: zinc ribbon domain-containing protein [Lentisphaeria bacterium]|nr:zinc ribbon domain-containing protein [Lentisphaeria bacterium]